MIFLKYLRIPTLIAILAWPASTSALPLSTVHVGDQTWLQPLDFINTSWDDVAEVCDAFSGNCNGSIGDVSLDGWHWATTSEVGELFDAFLGVAHFGAGSTNMGTPGVGDTAWANAFFDAGFMATSSGNDIGDGTPARFLSGFTRSTYVNGTYALGAWLEDALANGSAYRYDQAHLQTMSSVFTSTSRETTGHFFYKVAVPAPGTPLLLALGLAGMLVPRFQRGKARK